LRHRGDRFARTGTAPDPAWQAERAARPQAATLATRIRRLQEITAALLATRLPEAGAGADADAGLGAGVGTLGRLALLDALSAHLAEASGEREVAGGVARLLVPALGDWAGVFLEDGGAPALAASSGDAPLGALVAAHLLADPAARLAGACHCEDVSELRDGPTSPGGGRPAIAVGALCVNRRPLGALVVARAERSSRPPADRALLGEVSHRTALALGHGRALREAERAARAREDLLHVASHELRSPLGTLRLTIDLLARDLAQGDGAGADARLRSIARQADRLTRLSDALLDASRITAGRLELDLEEGDLSALARHVAARLFEDDAEAPSVVVDASAPVRCPLDAARVDQVLSNLLSNAVKYGEGRPVRIAVWRDSDRACVAVEDHGIGIAPQDVERIFERFERAVPGHAYGGIGLGLWIVSRVVEAHGGTIDVRSAPGEGSTFTIGLPLVSCAGDRGRSRGTGRGAAVELDP
jgi:signal transduction histidine kinase